MNNFIKVVGLESLLTAHKVHFAENVSRDNLDEKSGDQDENLRIASGSMIAAGAVTRKRYLPDCR